MNCLPVIKREMRSACRRTWTFKLRLLFALAGAAACLVILVMPRLPAAQRGRTMLVLLSFLSLTFCLVTGGFLTADCVSSEKREGTLGLLFLTPLKGMDIVLGKMGCQGLQMFYGICAIFPAFFAPLLAGGVTWAEVSRILLALLFALLLSVSVGMFISVLGRDSRKTLSSTFATLVLFAAVPMVYLMVHRVFLALPLAPVGLPQISPIFTVNAGFDSSYHTSNGPTLYWGSLFAIAMLSLVLVAAAGALLGRVFQTHETVFTLSGTRRVTSRFAGVLDRNPYEWMILRNAPEAHSAGALTHILILFFAVMLWLSLSTNHWQEGFIAAFFTALALHLLTKLHFAVEASRQISTDQHTGALELLLVSALPENSVVDGHQAAFRRLSRRPLFILIALNLALELCVLLCPGQLHMDLDASMMFSVQFLGGIALAAADFKALRWLALLKGLRASSHVRAVVLSFTSVMVLPWIGIGLVVAFVASVQPRNGSMTFIFSLWVMLSLIYDWLLIRRCRAQLQRGLRRIAAEG